MATVGERRVGAKEDNAGERARHTVIVYSSSDGVSKAPEVLFKANGPGSIKGITWKHIPTNVSARFTPTATYDEESTMAMLQEKYGIRPTSEMLGCGYRSLIIDQFAGQITPGAFAEMPAPRKIPLVIRGQLTPYPQAADRRHNQIFKKVYA